MQISTASRPSSVTASRAYTPSPLSPGVLPSNGHVRITYTLSQSLQSSPHSAVIIESLRTRLQPLRNLHWRPSSGTLPGSSIRTVQSLDAELIPLDVGVSSARLSTTEGFGPDAGRSQIPGTVLAKPFINLWLGICEDADAYKNVVRRQLKDWVASVTSQSKRDQEWLIVLVTVSSPGQDIGSSGGKRLFQMKGNIIDRMRADFTLAKRDRCVQLNYVSGGQDDPAAWTELIAKIKEAIVMTLDGRVAERIDDVRRTEAQRAVPGWNFCTFFVLKESIAESFEGMTLLDAALVQYTELEASFYQVLKEKNLSWFGKLGGTAPGDDAAPLLSITKKPYRDLILSNAISIFDFRCYLMARQCLLLAKMGAVADVATKAARFISSFARTLRENENSLSEPFLESWIYSCALNVVDECDAWLLGASGQEPASDPKGPSYSAAKCELLELARTQLDKIGIRAGHLPRTIPFTTSLPDQPLKSRPTSGVYDPHAEVTDLDNVDYKRLSRTGVTNASLLEAIDSISSFDELYRKLIDRIIDTCNSSGRTRSAARLQGILAALYLHRNKLSDANCIYSELPTQYFEQRWPVLESYMRAQHLETSKTSEEMSSPAWIHQVLALVKADLSIPESIQTEKSNSRIKKFFEEALKAADELSSDLMINDFSPLSIRVVTDTACLDESQDGSTLVIVVTNTLPLTVNVNYIRVLLAGCEGTSLNFEHRSIQAPPGESTVTLLCPDPIFGLFTTAEHEYQISRFIFKLPPPELLNNSKMLNSPISEARAVVRIPSDPRAVRLEMEMPRHIVLGDQRVLFRIRTGRNNIKSGTLSVVSQVAQIKYDFEAARIVGKDPGTIKLSRGHASMENILADQELTLSVPYVGSPRNDELEATLSFAYTTDSQNNVTRNVKFQCKAYVGLPLVVNISDKFRNQRLFTNVIVHSANQELVRIAKVTLSNPSNTGKLAVKSCNRSPVSMVIRPNRPAPFLFQIEASDPNDPPIGEALQLVITYRSLHEDITKIIRGAVGLSEAAASQPRLQKEYSESIKSEIISDTTWIDMFELVCLSSADIDLAAWTKQLIEKSPVKLNTSSVLETIEDMRRINGELRANAQSGRSEWRTVTMPFDVPLMSIINRVQIAPHFDPMVPKYAGQPIDASLNIASSFHWSGNADGDIEYTMQYDVSCDMDSGWLVCGPKRGEYIAKDGSTHTIQLTLLPLRHGTLSLPIVLVQPLSGSEEGRRPSCETWQADAAKKLEVLPRNTRSTFVVAMPVSVI